MLEKLKSEPVRLRIYTLALLVSGYLVARGYISLTDAEFIGSVALVVLGVETSRARVTPTRKRRRKHKAA